MPDSSSPVDPRKVMERCAPFAELPPDVVNELLERMKRRTWPAGAVIIRQGEVGDWLMIVLDGAARADVRAGGAEPHTVAHFGPSDLVGEMALLTRQPRTVDVIAETEVTALVLAAPDFDEIGSLYPEVGMVLTHLVADRLGGADVDGLTGKVVDRYRIVRCVGRGAMAIVYEGTEMATGERVALKMMSHRLIYQRGALARFQREAAMLESVSHPNIARVHHKFHAYRTYFIAMEFCDGPTLAKYLSQNGALGEAAVRGAVGQLAAALACLHGLGSIHRDLKPSNVLVSPGGVLKLADFGLAKPVAGSPITAVTEVRAALGTPQYMPPEALVGDDTGPECDTYALGCVALEALQGRCPFLQPNFTELLDAKRRFVVPPAAEIGSGISAEFHAFLVRALAASPEFRSCDLSRVAKWAAPLAA